MNISTSVPITEVNGIAVNADYLQTKNCTVCSSREVKYIVMHYTGNAKDTAIANAKYFYNNTLSASAHFFVDNDSIYQSVAVKDRAWHCGASTYYHGECRNTNSIGIEMCCTAENYIVSETTIELAAQLCASACKLIGITADTVDTYVIRHYDVTHKNCPAQWVADEGGFTVFKERVKGLLTQTVVEYTTINDIIWELGYRGIISDKNLWLGKCNEDVNIYWFCRKLCQYVRTKNVCETADDMYDNVNDIIWELQHRGIISNTELWTDYMFKDVNVYCLLQKAVHYCRTN